MSIGRVSGSMLESNLLREGVDLAFETDLLYLDVNNQRIGVKNSSPQYDLDINGTTKANGIEVSNSATVADISISGTTIETTQPILTLGTADNVVYQNKLTVGSIDLGHIESNVISTNSTNTDLELSPSGTGSVEIFANTVVYGDLTVSGTITADGNIIFGDSNTDSITFNAEIASDIIPDIDNTYSLGSLTKRWQNVYANNLFSEQISANEIEVDGINLLFRPGNIYYVAENGSDSASGTHPNDPYSTIKFAITQASTGDTIYIYPGVYQEEFPINVPAGITIQGHNEKSVYLEPTELTQENNVFLLNGETCIKDLTIQNFYSPGYAFSFNTNFTITDSAPLIKNVIVNTKGTITSESDPRGFDAGDAGRGVYLDGSVVSSNSKDISCIFHDVKFITPGVDALTFTNGVKIDWINCSTYFANKSINAIDGILGAKSSGKTAFRVENVVGTFSVGETITYYDTDGTTVIASGIINSIDDDDKFYINGKQENFETLLEFQTRIGNSSTDQDIRFSGGATANSFTLIDFTDFGGQLKSSGSISSYGTYGVYGNGPGVLINLIGQTFSYIGSGKRDDNDTVNTIRDNEITEIDRAKIRFSSLDHVGNFNLGNLFQVDQQANDITITNSDLNITTKNGISVTTNNITTLITGEKIESGNLRIIGNKIQSLINDIELESLSGVVKFNSTGSLKLPSGTTSERPNVAVPGMIRYNTDNNLFEGYNGNWISLNGVRDLDADTYITAELTPGANDNIIRFYANGILVADLSENGFRSNRIEIDEIFLDGNQIGTTATNVDLEISANGTGSVIIDNLSFKDSTITNNLSNSVTIFENTDNGYVKFSGSNGLVIPSGQNNERPTSPYLELGMLRFNTEQDYVEIFNGTSWISIAGSSGSINYNQAEDLAISQVLMLG